MAGWAVQYRYIPRSACRHIQHRVWFFQLYAGLATNGDVVAVCLPEHFPRITPGTPCCDRRHLYPTRALYGSWTQNLPHHPPHACGTPDAAGVAAGHDRLSGACQTRQDDLTRRRWGPDHRHCCHGRDQPCFVYKWAQRFLAQGVEGLADKPGRGRVPRQAPPQEQHGMDVG